MQDKDSPQETPNQDNPTPPQLPEPPEPSLATKSDKNRRPIPPKGIEKKDD